MNDSNGYTQVHQSMSIRAVQVHGAMRDEFTEAKDRAIVAMMTDKQYTVGVLWWKRFATQSEALDMFIGGDKLHQSLTRRRGLRGMLVEQGYLTMQPCWTAKLLDEHYSGQWGSIAKQVEIHACFHGSSLLNTKQCEFVRTFGIKSHD